jgi:hypothetical protein
MQFVQKNPFKNIKRALEGVQHETTRRQRQHE